MLPPTPVAVSLINICAKTSRATIFFVFLFYFSILNTCITTCNSRWEKDLQKSVRESGHIAAPAIPIPGHLSPRKNRRKLPVRRARRGYSTLLGLLDKDLTVRWKQTTPVLSGGWTVNAVRQVVESDVFSTAHKNAIGRDRRRSRLS